MKLLICDMDGTLFDSRRNITASINHVRKMHHGLPPLSENEVAYILNEFTGDPKDIYPAAECCSYPSYRTRGSRQALEELTDHLQQAERPVIIAGGGANHSQAGEEIKAAAEWLSAPVVTTISGQGIIDDEHPLALGVIGDNGFHPHAIRAVEEADVLLYVGCKMGSVSTIKWTLPSPKEGRKILQIDLDPELLSNNFDNTLSVAGDAKLVFADLVTLLKGQGAARTPSDWLNDLNAERVKFWVEAEVMLQADDTPLKPQRIIAALNKRLPSPSIVVSDRSTAAGRRKSVLGIAVSMSGGIHGCFCR
jgi:acetolactate synthase-1/2/3 large subunit